MEVHLTEDQALLRETTRRFLDAEADMASVRAWGETDAGFDRGWWRTAAELGWTSLLVPEHLGGGSVSGAGLLDLVVVVEEAGRSAAPGPMTPVNLVLDALVRTSDASRHAEVIGELVAGTRIATLAHAEPESRWLTSPTLTTATPDGAGYRVAGCKSPVEAAAEADLLLVSAAGPDGPVLAVVPATASGVTITPLRSLDLSRRFATVAFDGVAVPADAVIATGDDAQASLDRLLDLGATLACAEACGAVDHVFGFTLQYAFDRYTFGRPLASYQALKHRFADLKWWLETCLGVSTTAARAMHANTVDCIDAVSTAKAYVGEKGPAIVQDCVQLHGGIGVTWEHDLHVYLRRVLVSRILYGDPATHLERLGRRAITAGAA